METLKKIIESIKNFSYEHPTKFIFILGFIFGFLFGIVF